MRKCTNNLSIYEETVSHIGLCTRPHLNFLIYVEKFSFWVYCTLQMHCTEYWKQIFPEMKLRSLVPNVYIHVFVSDLYISTICPQTQYSKKGGPIVGIYKSLTDT